MPSSGTKYTNKLSLRKLEKTTGSHNRRQVETTSVKQRSRINHVTQKQRKTEQKRRGSWRGQEVDHIETEKNKKRMEMKAVEIQRTI